jgi:hypothetical protein
MQSAKRIILKKIKTLWRPISLLTVICCSPGIIVFSQDNSPYSRYGIGDLAPSTNVINRAMGGVVAGYTDVFSINFSNPASFAAFQAIREQTSKKLLSGRAVLDVGVNFEGRRLSEPNQINSYKTNNALFSHVQVGVPLRQNWGLSFGLRPVSRINYNIIRRERLKDPLTGNPIDSAETSFQGEGGAYLPTIGTGFTIFRKFREKKKLEERLNAGISMGYLFGEKDYSVRRSFINDSVNYYAANYETQTNFNGMYFSAGLQYMIPVRQDVLLTLGTFGSWGQNLDASKDVIRETYVFDDNIGNIRLDSISDQRNIKGILRMPAMFTFGFVIQQFPIPNQKSGWIVGADFSHQQWNEYRIYGEKDSVQNKWDFRVGGQYNPVPKREFFSRVSYRAGFSFGPDYIRIGQKLSQFSATLGLGLPINYSSQAPNQVSIINVAFEYLKRGNNDNLLKENMYRLSLGFSLSDFWFIRRKYD